MRVSWRPALPLFKVDVSLRERIEEGANHFRIHAKPDHAPSVGAAAAAVDPEGWRIEGEVVSREPSQTEPGYIAFLVCGEGAAVRGVMIGDEWQPRD